MEVLTDHRDAGEGQTTHAGTVTRRKFLTSLALSTLFIGGDCYHDLPAERQSEPKDEGPRRWGSVDPYALKSGTTLIGQPLHIEQEEKYFDVLITQTGGALELTVNGKLYGIRNTVMIPGVSLERSIADVTMKDGLVTLFSPDYGEATVDRKTVVEVLSALATAETPTVELQVKATYTPKAGTAVAVGVFFKNLWQSLSSDVPETYPVEFERRRPTPYAIASNDGGDLTSASNRL